jgi:ribonuclease-3
MLWSLRAATEIEKRLGYKFRDRGLLELALTHRSHANERGANTNYERLEFLGDAILGAVAAEWLYRRFPDKPEGELSRWKSRLVSARSLGREAARLGIGAALRIGVGEERSGGRAKLSLLADSLEAVFGAVYLDGGHHAAGDLIAGVLESALAASGEVDADAKTALQERAQARGWQLPEYRLILEEGPDHQKVFTIECWLRGERAGTGVGESKKIAEQRAASAALAAGFGGPEAAAGEAGPPASAPSTA